jgi:hypothetical protein
MNSSKPTQSSTLLTREEVGLILHCSPLTVGRKQKQWGLEPIRAGRQVVYSPTNLEIVILKLRRVKFAGRRPGSGGDARFSGNKKQSQVPPSQESSMTADSKIGTNGNLST